MNRCDCHCRCWRSRELDCDKLCERCWRDWCHGSPDHGPAADPSYLAVYGIASIWAGWLISIGRGDVVAQPPGYSSHAESKACPSCGTAMVPRVDAWKCYRQEKHTETVVVSMKLKAPRSPDLKVIDA